MASTLSPNGRKWVTQVLDPFHDHPNDPVGMPDEIADRSVIYCVNDTVTLSVTSAVSDLHVYTLPELCSVSVGSVATNGQTVWPYEESTGWRIPRPRPSLDSDGNEIALGLFNWALVDTGAQTIPVVGFGPNPDPLNTAPVTFPGVFGHTNYTQYCSGRARVVSAAYEIRNTSPELYRGGSSVSYRMPQGISDKPLVTAYGYGVPGAGVNCLTSCSAYRAPPSSTSQAILIPDSVVLSSEEGNYSVVPIHSENEGALCFYAPVVLAFSDAPNVWNDNLVSVTKGGYLTESTDGGVTDLNTARCHRPVHCDTVGSYHSGLVVGSTFTINFRTYIEVFPAGTDTIYPLSRRSTPQDNAAEQCAIMCFQNLPATVPVSWNESSKWWQLVLRTMGALAPALGSLFGPEGTALGAIAAVALNATADRKPKPKTPPKDKRTTTTTVVTTARKSRPLPSLQRAKRR